MHAIVVARPHTPLVINVTSAFLVVAIIVAAELLGWAAERIGQPKVLGELVTGLILGASVLHLLNPSDPVISTLSEVGLWVLLFDIGLHTDIRALAQAGRTATIVAVAGVVVPFVLGWGCAALLGLTPPQALLCGAALTATSIGISARVLQDLHVIDSIEGRVVLGAAVLDDIAGLAILAAVSAMAGETAAGGEQHSIFASLGILVAFAAGLLLHRTRLRHRTQRITKVLGFIVVPVFFAAVGAAVQIQAIAGMGAIVLLIVLTLVAIVGKFVAGYAPWGFKGSKALVGIAMIPRGEVGLVFATTARAAGIFDNALFAIVTLVVMITTFLTPPLLMRVAKYATSAATQ